MADDTHHLTNIAEEGSRPSTSNGLTRILSNDNGLNRVLSNDKHAHYELQERPHRDHPPMSPKMRARRKSTASRVSMDFFDPEGVHELRRTLTNQSQKLGFPPIDQRSDVSSERTFSADDEDFDLDKVFRQMIQRREAGEVKQRQLGVVFRDLRVVGVRSSASLQPTLGSMFNPKDAIASIQNALHPPVRDILSGFEGVVKPGEMLLVLGSPGAGCSTLLKTLTNHREEYQAVHGEVHYDSITPEELKKHFRGDVQYCPEDDIHFPTLTVDQTIQFAARTRTPRNRVEYTRAEFPGMLSNLLTTVFGLKHVRNTPVGDAQIRGISGGQKKRVSIAEALATRACIGAWDNSTRGLDASTALEFVRALRISTDAMHHGTIVSIYQAGETLYKHFDKVCIIYEGRMAYYGPADQAKQYFAEMGYQPANRQTTPDFLVAVTDPNARIPIPGKTNVPRTADEFAEYFKNSMWGKRNREEIEEYIAEKVGKPDLAQPYAESARAEFAKRSGKRNPYMLTIPQQVAAVMTRKVQIIRGSMAVTFINLFSFVFQGLIMGSLFLKMPEQTSAFFSRGGVLFFALLFSALTAMAEIPALYSQRRIVNRHEKAALYHPFIEALAHTLVDIPIAFFITMVFAIILYFMTGLQRTASQFFVFILFLLTMTVAMKSWFRAVAAAMKSEAAAQSVAGIATLALVIYTGFTIPKPSMVPALRWITYINPLRYGFEALMTNEFRTLNGSCDALVPQGPGYEGISLANQVCAVVGAIAGEDFVSGSRFLELSYGFKWSNTWLNLGIVIIFAVGFIAILLVFSEYNTTTSEDAEITQYKRGAKTIPAGTTDEEGRDAQPLAANDQKMDTAKGDSDSLKMKDTFTWQHVDYTVPIPGEADRRLLDDVSGYVAPGKLTALMGESGAGKTTLLNVLARRVYSGVVTGDMLVNGQIPPDDFQSQTGYCQQMDTHEPTASVREALLFSARMRQPPSVPDSEKEAYVEKCIQMCGLEEYADAIVGTLNVEYRKRTTIAVELAAKPKLLLFLDEPTSGLDSQSAWAIVSFLRNLADQGQAILCTIHQPSAELFQVFDRMLLLRKGGQTVYFGDLGHNATTLIQYFEKNGGRKCDPEENPAEYMLDVIGAGATATSAQNWHDIWKASSEAGNLQSELNEICTEGRNRPAVTSELKGEFATPWVSQVKELWWRSASAFWRNPSYLFAKLILNVFGGLFVGFTFFKSENTMQGVQNQLFAIFMVCIISVPLASQIQVPFINSRTIYEIRERPSRMYSWTALITAHVLIEIPWDIFGSTLMFLCWYWTVGFDSSRAGYSYLILGVIYPMYYATIGLAVAAMSPTAEIAAIIFSLMFSFVLSFNGVMQPYRSLGWWRWMYRVSPYTYLIEGLLGQAIGRQDINCSELEFVQLNPPSGTTCGDYLTPYIEMAGGYLTNPAATESCNFCNMRTTDEFLMVSFNIDYANRWRNFGLMVVYTVFNVLCIFALTYLFRIRTKSIFASLASKFKRSKK